MARDTSHAEPTALTFPVAHLVPGRDTAEIRTILRELRAYGFVPLAEYEARPFTVPHDQRAMPAWVNNGKEGA